MSFEPRPNFVGDKEVISFNFSSEGEFRDTEVSLPVGEVIVIFGVFV